jgi:hypothetical protein
MMQKSLDKHTESRTAPGQKKDDKVSNGIGTGRGSGRICECCGNDYDKSIEVVLNGISHYFDSFECAIHTLAPVCAHCKCRIIGHGMEAGGTMFCCAHCASKAGVTAVKDRV